MPWKVNRRIVAWFLIICAFLPAVVAFGILYGQDLPLPYQDDYHAILAFAVAYEQLPSLGGKILEIAAEQHNEYKLGLEHSIVAAELEVTHHVNFALLTALGDLFLLPIGYLLWRTYRQGGPNQVLAFLPISCLFFALTYWENENWAMTGMQNTPVILFSLLAIYLIAPRNLLPATRMRLFLGCLAAALAAFTSANGFLLGPVGLLIFFARRQYVRALTWCAAFLLPLAAYLYRFSPVTHPAGRAPFATRPLFFFAFLGTVLGFRWPAALLGLGIMIIVLLAIRSRFDRTNPAAVYFTLWVLLTACLVAWVRGAVGVTVSSRYSLYSILMMVFCYAFLAHYLPARWPAFNRTAFYAAATVLAACYCAAADLHAWQELGLRRHMVVAGIEFYRARPDIHSPMIDPNLDRAAPQEKAYEQGVLTEAIAKGLYTLPPKP